MKNFKFLFSILIAMIMLTSCESDDEGTSNTNYNTELDFGLSIQRDFTGRIVDEASAPIDNVIVTIGNKVATTDDNGMFIINSATVKEEQAFIIAEKAGYLKGMRSVVPTDGANTVRFMLITENVAGTVASGSNSEVTLGNGTKVKFDGEFKDENDNPYSGNVDVLMYHLDPSNPSIDAIMPGSLQAQNEDGNERVLETYGMLNVELRGDSGEKLNIADGSVAEIEIPVDTAQIGVAPSTIPLWHFDEDKGYWIQDGEANLVGGKYIATVSHFSWWNCDAQFPTVILCLNVVDTVNTPLSNVVVELWRTGATYGRQGISNGNGEICGLIPANETLTLKAFDQCGVEVHSTTIGPFSTDTNYGNVVLPSVTSSVITGNLVNCSNANVTNGYVALTYGGQYATIPVTNGSFSLSVIECASLPDFILEGVDYGTFQTTTEIQYNFSNPSVGNIIACNSITEFISVQVDNDPAEFYLNSLSGHSNGPNAFSVGAQNATGSSFLSGGNSITPGTYSFTSTPSFWIESSNINIDYNVPNTLQFTLSNYGAIGGYIDMIISGNYTDLSGNLRTLSCSIHVVRDN
ncbi:hypothetical protein HNV08_15120 [Winogradskyella eckloniae]|uniref:hypothetical protein n=1 Tax=Winogradskyella eckloniae TaxID=1089306 RepID=UPI0015651628|nr:hypothetical protein [Winogradskyella eckloniae]NRD21386.1 hypothetical protein [Winogradskyella eckloniae]